MSHDSRGIGLGVLSLARSLVWVGIVVWALQVAASIDFVYGDDDEREAWEPGPRWTAEDILWRYRADLRPRVRSAAQRISKRALVEHHEERAEVVRAMLQVASMREVGDEIRSSAILYLGSIEHGGVLRFAAQNVRLWLHRQLSSRDAFRRSVPCLTVLTEAGWTSVPYCLDRILDLQTDEEDVKYLGLVLRRVCGPHAVPLLESHRSSLSDDAVALRARIARTIGYTKSFESRIGGLARPPELEGAEGD